MLARLLCPGYFAQATAHPATCLPSCLLAAQATLPKATEHPASCLPACLLDRLLCPGYCTPCHLPACLFAGQATLPRLLQFLPTACRPVCCPGYSAKQTLPPDCLPACLLARLFCPGYSAQATAHPATCLPACLLPRLLFQGYCTSCLLPACLFAVQATLPRLAHPADPACLFAARLLCLLQTLPPDCLPACVLPRLLCPAADCLPLPPARL